MTNESVIAPSPGVSIVDAVDGPVVCVGMVEEGVDVCLNDEEASPEVLEFDEESEDEDESEEEGETQTRASKSKKARKLYSLVPQAIRF